MRQEFMQGSIQQTDGNFAPVHHLENAVKIFHLYFLQFIQNFDALFRCFGKNHLSKKIDTLCLKEHVFGAAQTDTFGAETDC